MAADAVRLSEVVDMLTAARKRLLDGVISLGQADLDRSPQKVTSPSPFIPRNGLARQALLDGPTVSREGLREVLAKAEAFDLGQLSFPHHPVLGRLDGYQWLLYLGQHELRHLQQVERSSMEAPG